MTTCCEVDGAFTILELPSPTFPFPFVCAVTILYVLPPLVVLIAERLVDGVALAVPHDGVGEVVFGLLLPLVNPPILSLRLFMHSTYHDFKWLKRDLLQPYLYRMCGFLPIVFSSLFPCIHSYMHLKERKSKCLFAFPRKRLKKCQSVQLVELSYIKLSTSGS
jgi:hypothetical protein